MGRAQNHRAASPCGLGPQPSPGTWEPAPPQLLKNEMSPCTSLGPNLGQCPHTACQSPRPANNPSAYTGSSDPGSFDWLTLCVGVPPLVTNYPKLGASNLMSQSSRVHKSPIAESAGRALSQLHGSSLCLHVLLLCMCLSLGLPPLLITTSVILDGGPTPAH